MMNIQLNKKALIGGVLLALTSVSASATGGGGSGYAGELFASQDNLSQRWNGKEGIQQTAIGGVLAQWYADSCGQQIAQAHIPSGWGAPAMLDQIEARQSSTQIASVDVSNSTTYSGEPGSCNLLYTAYTSSK